MTSTTSLGRATVLSPLQAFERIQGDEDLILLDIREPIEGLADGCLEGATRIPMDELLWRASVELPQDATILIYCAHGIRSASVGMWLMRQGYLNVFDLGGGIDLWKRSGLPVIRDQAR